MNFFKFIGKLFVWVNKQSSAVTQWSRKIPLNVILSFIIEADRISPLSPAEKRDLVAKNIKNWLESKGCFIPSSVLNCLIEIAYQSYLKSQGKEPKSPV